MYAFHDMPNGRYSDRWRLSELYDVANARQLLMTIPLILRPSFRPFSGAEHLLYYRM
jgi:hypothetical protein